MADGYVYRVDKKVDGEWFYWGTYDEASHAAYACWDLAKSGADDCKVTELSANEDDEYDEDYDPDSIVVRAKALGLKV